MAQFGYRPTPAAAAAAAAAAGQAAQTGAPSAPTCTTPGATPPSPPMTGGGSPPAAPPAAQRCCDTGRPLFTDPLTGQPVCSCQYEVLSYGRPALPALSVYSAAAAAYPDGVAAYFPGLGAAADQSPFYGPAASLELKENLAAGAAGWPYPSVYHPYDAAFAGYPFNGYGMDLNGARRKNATRETTSTLKAWLNEHKKNPYPTKGEKIMLAIITKMTLTQVSTWFANARRRLKKENKMTWEPRNRVEDDDNNNDDDDQDRKSTDGKDLLDSKDSGTASSSEEGEQQRPPPAPHPRLESDWPSTGASGVAPDSPPPATTRSSPSPPPRAAPKPRIWSLADMASKGGGGSGGDEGGGGGGGGSGLYASAAAAAAARLPSTLSRLPALHASPYQRPPDFYRALYAHAPSPAELLESYQRRLAAPATPAAAAPQAASRASPSSPSSLSSGSEPTAGSMQQPLALGKV